MIAARAEERNKKPINWPPEPKRLLGRLRRISPPAEVDSRPAVPLAEGRGRGQQPSRKLEGENMAEKMRYNKIIDLLEDGKPVFSTSTVPNGSLDDLSYIADADYAAVIMKWNTRVLASPPCVPPCKCC